jgi:hypothetical protein
MINTALADVVSSFGFEDVSVSGFWIRAAGTTDARRIVEIVQSREAEEIRELFKVSEDYLDNLKFNECLPADIAQSTLDPRSMILHLFPAPTTRRAESRSTPTPPKSATKEPPHFCGGRMRGL